MGHALAFAYSLALGLLVGIERERSNVDGHDRAFGIRTFAVLALLGTIVRSISLDLVAVGAIVIGALLVVGYVRTSQTDPGTTTEVSAIATYFLGSVCYTDAALALALGVAMTVLLVSKSRLHRLARETLTQAELDDALKFLVIAVVVFPLLPNRGIGPYGVLNPFRIWSLVVIIASISWVGYLATRLLGSRRGLVATGFASGFVSATAATAAMARSSRDASKRQWAVSGAQFASVATYVQLVVVVAVVSPELANKLVVPSILGALALGAVALLGLRGHVRDAQSLAPRNEGDRVFALAPTLGLAGLITLSVLAGRWLSTVLGSGGVIASVGVLGLADAHSGSVAGSLLFHDGLISSSVALWTISVSLSANAISKIAIAFSAGGVWFGRRFLIGFLASHAVFVAALAITAVR